MTPAKRSTTTPRKSTTVRTRVKPAPAPAPTEEPPDGSAAPQVVAARKPGLSWLRQAGIGVWLGLGIVVVGFGLIAFAWSKTAGELDVALQVPYLVSAGLTGLGLILVGLLVINLSVKRQEVTDRSRQLEELIETMIRIRKSIEGG